jgi:hypothetical protein
MFKAAAQGPDAEQRSLTLVRPERSRGALLKTRHATMSRDVDQAPRRGPVGRAARVSRARPRVAAQILAWARRFARTCGARCRFVHLLFTGLIYDSRKTGRVARPEDFDGFTLGRIG